MATMCHLPNIKANPRLKLITTCDINETAAKNAWSQFNAQKFCTDWHKIISDPQIDLILVATHTNLRAAIIVAACKAGKAVYVEKPLADSIEAMEQIGHAVSQSQIAVTPRQTYSKSGENNSF
jgi:predicted dehydrogenase